MPVKVKICGLKTAEALDAALDAGAEFVGFVFFEKSPRFVDFSSAEVLGAQARGRAVIVALLVDPTDALVVSVAAACAPEVIQLHGSESPERVAEIGRRTGCKIMKAIKVETAADAARALDYADVADTILFDAKAPKDAPLPGGNGVPFDWRVLAETTPKLNGKWMLSGGLNPDNVAEAIRLTGAPAVDVSSGVETAPGEKSDELIRRFLRAVKTANQQA